MNSFVRKHGFLESQQVVFLRIGKNQAGIWHIFFLRNNGMVIINANGAVADVGISHANVWHIAGKH